MVLLKPVWWYHVANLDKTSVKDEVGRLKADFDRLGIEGKVTPESQAVMSSLFIIIELILAIFLERSTNKNSKTAAPVNSSSSCPNSKLLIFHTLPFFRGSKAV